MKYSIELNQVSKRYGSHIVFTKLNLTLSPGIHALQGENGVGKSTLIKMLCGLEAVDEGGIFINGLSLKKKRVLINQHRVYLPDQPAFYENATVKEIVHVLLSMRKASIPVAQQLIDYWDLIPLFSKKWRGLSLGQRKRVFFGVSLMESVGVWVLDEPSSGLDHAWMPKLISAVTQHSQKGLVLVSSHDEEFLKAVKPARIRLERINGSTQICESS